MMIKAYWGKYYVHVLSNRLLKGIKHTVNIDNISLIFLHFSGMQSLPNMASAWKDLLQVSKRV